MPLTLQRQRHYLFSVDLCALCVSMVNLSPTSPWASALRARPGGRILDSPTAGPGPRAAAAVLLPALAAGRPPAAVAVSAVSARPAALPVCRPESTAHPQAASGQGLRPPEAASRQEAGRPPGTRFCNKRAVFARQKPAAALTGTRGL